MAEKGIVSQIPPVDRETPTGGFLRESTPGTPASSQTQRQSTEPREYVLIERQENQPSQSANLRTTDSRRMGLVGAETQQAVPAAAPRITVTPAQEAAYLTFLLGMVSLGLVAVILFSRVSKVIEQKKKAVTVAGGLILVLALSYTVSQIVYSQALNNETDFAAWVRPLFWIIATPFACFILPALIGAGTKAKPFFLTLGGAASGSFLLILLADLIGAPVAQILLGILSLGAAGFASFLLLKGVSFIPNDTRPILKKFVGLFSKGLVLIWIIYPLGLIIAGAGIPEATRQLIYTLTELAVLIPVAFSLMGRK